VKEKSLSELKKDLQKLAIKSNVQLDQELISLLQDSIERVRSVDELFYFFEKTVKELRTQLTTVQFSPGQIIQYEGSLIDMFLRRCIFAFSQLMFEDLQALFDSFVSYREGKLYHFKQAQIALESWV